MAHPNACSKRRGSDGLWLAKRSTNESALRWMSEGDGSIKTIESKVRYADGAQRKVKRPVLEVFEPTSDKQVAAGTANRRSATYPVTGFTTPVTNVKAQWCARAGASPVRSRTALPASPLIRLQFPPLQRHHFGVNLTSHTGRESDDRQPQVNCTSTRVNDPSMIRDHDRHPEANYRDANSDHQLWQFKPQIPSVSRLASL